MAKPKEMLSALLRIGQLTAYEKEVFESMWDQAHRGKLSNKQLAWIEKVFYKQGLDKSQERPAKKKPAPKIGFMYNPNGKRTVSASNMKQFETICPHIVKDSEAYQRVEAFFKNGGERFELRAGAKP